MKLAIFDVDGTIVDSQNYICEAQRRAREWIAATSRKAA